MSEFTLDTSGEVWLEPAPLGSIIAWPDLDPFTQGYITSIAMDKSWVDGRASFAFSDLAPSTLAAILKDCGDYREVRPRDVSAYAGKCFWTWRQAGEFPPFPPLTPSLGDDGRVYLRAAS